MSVNGMQYRKEKKQQHCQRQCQQPGNIWESKWK